MHSGKWIIVLTMVLLFMLCACSGSGSPPETIAVPEEEIPAAPVEEQEAAVETESPAEPDEPRVVPLAEAEFHPDLAEGNEGVQLDLSAVSSGYIAVKGESESRLKLQVMKDDEVYTYDIASDGTVSILPLQCGDGMYTVRVMENVVDSKYAELYSASCEVVLDDEFQPFIRSNDYVKYNEGSECVSLAAELAGGAEDIPEVVASIYEFISTNIVYDNAKAATVGSGYMPVPDDTLASGKGICFDYASLAAAMLRSQGIPTKVIFGYVSPDDLYHAWNMFYTEESGWITVGFEVKGDTWNRIDLTFAANGADADFIGDGSNYADVYNY